MGADYDDLGFPFVQMEKPAVKTIYVAPTSLGMIRVEPIMDGSIIGRDVCRCESCMTRIDKVDLFCRHCGARITGWEKYIEEVPDYDQL